MAIKLKNNATSFLAADITSTDTSISVTSGDGSKFPSLGSGDWFYLTIANKDNKDIFEIVKVTSVSGDVFVVERGAEDTTPKDFTLNDVVEQRPTAQTLYDLSTGKEPVSNSNRSYLDEIFLAMNGGPVMDESKLLSFNKKYAPKLIVEWDTKWGSYLTGMIYNYTTGDIIDDVSFPTIADMADWVANNVPESNGYAQNTVVFKPYEVVDPSIPQLTRSYAINMADSMFRNGQNGATKSYASSDNGNALDTIFNHFFNTGGATLDRRACWLPNAKRNRYGATNQGNRYTVSLQGTSSRYCWDGSNFVQTNSSEVFRATGDYAYAFFYLTGSLKGIYSTNSSWMEVHQHIRDGGSVMLIIALTSISDSTRRAIMMKPVGIDQFVMEYPDFDKYNLEMVFLNDKHQSGVDIRVITQLSDFPGQTVIYDENGRKMRLNACNWSLPQYDPEARSYNDYHYPRVRFRLRDKSTGKVSKLSKFEIYEDNAHKLNAGKFMLRNLGS